MTTSIAVKPIDKELSDLMAKIQRQHPYTQNDYEISCYKCQLTDEEIVIYMAWSVWQVKKDFDEGGRLTNRKIYLQITKELDYGYYKWVLQWLNEFHRIKEIQEHLNLILEYHESHRWRCPEYEDLTKYRDKIINAWMGIKPDKKEDQINTLKAYK